MSDSERPQDEAEPTRLSEDDLAGETTWIEEPTGAGAGEPGKLRCLGDFQLLREIGRGGMGVVYDARQVSLKRRVALKVLPPALGLTTQARQRFEREAQAAAKLHHTNIVPVHAVGEHDGYHFYAMELIEGKSLDQVLHQVVRDGTDALLTETVTRAATILAKERGTPGDLEPATTGQSGAATGSLGDTSAGSRPWCDAVAKLVAEVADGLHYAHCRGVIHRDIKPANLMLSSDGRLCITDFGLARVAQEPGITASGSLLGTPAYMSPEQIAAGRTKLDHRSDVYSLGVVLYELLTLQRPFVGESREEVLSAILTLDPRSPRRLNAKIPLDLETVCLKAIEKDPERRYATAEEMARDLRQYLHHGLITARRAGLLRRTWKLVRRNPTAATAIGLIIVGTATVTVLMSLHAKSATAREVEQLLLEGQLAWETGQPEGLAHAEQALTLAPDDPRARLLRARYLIESQATRGVVQEARDRLEQDPEDWVSHIILAHVGLNRYNPDLTVDARAHVEAVKALAPESADAFYLRALVATDPGERVELLNRALEIDPQYLQALTLRINTYRDLRDHQAALFDCDRLIATRPRSAKGHRMRSRVLQTMQDYPAALDAIEQAIVLTDSDAQPQVAAWNYQARAEIHAAAGNHGDAVADLDRALALVPDWDLGLRFRARYRNANGKHEGAAADARRAIELNPDVMRPHQELFLAYSRLGELDSLRDALEELATRLESWQSGQARANAESLLASWYRNLGESDESLAHLRNAVEATPDSPILNNMYAWELLTCEDAGLRDPAAALDLAIRANELTEFTNASNLGTLALAYHMTGKTSEAIEIQKKALSLVAEEDPAARAELERRLAEYETALAGSPN